MKKVSFAQFESLFTPIIKFLDESDRINDSLETLFPSSFVYSEHGNELLEYYIDLAENYLELDGDWFNWFVFENNMGKSELSAINDEKEYTIKSIEDLYNFLTLFN